MSSFPILDLVVGMIFLFFLLSIICSSAVEMIMTVFKIRARNLGEWLLAIFSKEIQQPGNKPNIKLGQAIMDHCSVTALSDENQPPAYIDAKNFTSALLEKLTYDPAHPQSIATNIDQFILAIQNTEALSVELQRVLLTYANEAKETFSIIIEEKRTESEIDIFQKKIENWYDTSMDRITGNLKSKYSRRFTLGIAILIVTILNADSISIARYLYSNPLARTQLAAQAYDATKDSAFINKSQRLTQIPTANKADSATLKQLQDSIAARMNDMKMATAALDNAIPLGWNNNDLGGKDGQKTWCSILTKISGLAATILAVMMGAPFWFDLLNKISNLRGNGTKPTTQSEKDNLK